MDNIQFVFCKMDLQCIERPFNEEKYSETEIEVGKLDGGPGVQVLQVERAVDRYIC